MRILWPDAIGYDEFLNMDVHETGVLEPFLQLGPGTDFVALLLERAVDFVVVPFESGAVVTAVFRLGVAVPVLKFQPTARLY